MSADPEDRQVPVFVGPHASSVLAAPGHAASHLPTDDNVRYETGRERGRLRRGAPLVARTWHLAPLLFLTLFMVTPFDASFPRAGIDPSWRTGINTAVAQHLSFGRDIVFTYGPYGGVHTRQYDPALPWLGVGGGLLLAAGFLVAVVVLFRGRPFWISLGVSLGVTLAVAAGTTTADARELVYPLIAALAVHRLLDFPADASFGWTRRACLVVLAAPFGLLPVVKLSSAPVVATGLLAAVLLLVLRRRWLEAIAFMLVPVLTTLALWSIAGQPVDALLDYARNSLPIITGYPQAMSLVGDATEVRLFALAAVVTLLTCLAGSRLPPGERLLVAMILTVTLLVVFKASMIRHFEDHALLVTFPLIVTSLATASFCRGLLTRAPVVLLSVGVAVTIYMTYPRPAGVPTTVRESFTAGPGALAQRLTEPGLFDKKYDDALARLRDQGLFADLPAGADADIYSLDQANLIAQGAHWNPRPVIQSYSAYTPALASLNADHLRGSDAPEHILFSVAPIDHRLPALEDGASWVPLLQHYRVISFDLTHDYLHLQHREQSVPVPVADQTIRLDGRLGRPLRIPSPGQAWLTRIDVRPTVLGRLRAALWKTAQVRITLRLTTGATATYRFVPEMGRSEFLLSPLVQDTDAMAGLFASDGPITGATAAPHVRTITMESEDPAGMWQADYSLELRAVSLPRSAAHRP